MHYGNISVELPGLIPQIVDPYTDVGIVDTSLEEVINIVKEASKNEIAPVKTGN